jgi:hypothetical protein
VCRACKVAVRCYECGVEKFSRTDKAKMTSQAPSRDKSKCYHGGKQTFGMCDDMKYFDVNWRTANSNKRKPQSKCLECKRSLLWVTNVAKKK